MHSTIRRQSSLSSCFFIRIQTSILRTRGSKHERQGTCWDFGEYWCINTKIKTITTVKPLQNIHYIQKLFRWIWKFESLQNKAIVLSIHDFVLQTKKKDTDLGLRPWLILLFLFCAIELFVLGPYSYVWFVDRLNHHAIIVYY